MPITPSRPQPPTLELTGFYRISVEQYRRMIDAGILVCGEPAELLEGFLVSQPRPASPRVASSRTRIHYAFADYEFPNWCFHLVGALTLSDSEPEPDFALVRGDISTHDKRFPGPGEVGIVGEVCDSSLQFDRREKGRIYARAGIPIYWIINVIDRQIEVYTNPQPAATPPEYTTRTDYPHGTSVPVVLDGVTVATLAVADLIP